MFYLFATAIVIGAAMLIVRLRGKPYPAWSLAILHGLFAVVGLLIMIITAVNDNNMSGTTHFVGALVVFGLAAVLGLSLVLGFHAKKRPLPVGLILAHGLIAAAAFVWLLA